MADYNEANNLERSIKRAFGLLGIAFGLFILIYAADYAYSNVLSSNDAGWVGVYTALVVLAYGFIAVLFVGILLLGINSLKEVALIYKKRR